MTVGFPVSTSRLVNTVIGAAAVLLVAVLTAPVEVLGVVMETFCGAGETDGDGESTRANLLGLLASIRFWKQFDFRFSCACFCSASCILRRNTRITKTMS